MHEPRLPGNRRLRLVPLLGLASLLLNAALAQAAGHKAPACQILSPEPGAHVSALKNIAFRGKAKLGDKAAGPLKYEWDFSGGVFGEPVPGSNPPAYKRPDGPKTKVQFVRDNAVYQVHFGVTDAQRRHCDAHIEVVVGSPPTNLPDVSGLVASSQKGAAPKGSQLAGKEGDIVVLPYPDLTLQAQTDARLVANLYNPATVGPFNTLNAVAYSKSRLPVQLSNTDVALQYQAASSAVDPAGRASINSTSQNYPLGSGGQPAPLFGATVQKTDLWGVPQRAADTLAEGYTAQNWMDMNAWLIGASAPDVGLKAAPALFPAEHGSYMPGKDAPYAVNAYQDFTIYNADSHSFSARNLPLTDIDDSGRVNPFPLMRVQAVDPNTREPLPNAPPVDAVVTSAKDFHCSECHAKGKIAANPAINYASFVKAYHSSPEYNQGYHCTPPTDCQDDFKSRGFFDAVDEKGAPSADLADQEYAAIRNALALHDFYDDLGMNYFMDGNRTADGKYGYDMAASCTWCHGTMINPLEVGLNFATNYGKKSLDQMYYPSLSEAMHRFHSRLQLDPGDKGKILRKADGRPLQWDDSKGPNPNSLFPTTDAQGNSLPMEQSCLRCHSGHREQLYRDRMYTAGVTCYDCHGDMAAVGQAHDKPKPGPEGETNRVEWLDQPDCGSCHMGDGNVGKGSPEAFSAGVMKRAFNGNDPSATSRKPMTQRFAVQPPKPLEIAKDDWVDNQYSTRSSILSITKPLYRLSRDKHGDVACGACHGGAHEVWENRNPDANDNQTALQLQGHTGTILECNVCHTADAFRLQGDLDGGTYSGDQKAGILGGPHNLHPVNDLYWFKSSVGDTANQDGSKYGGWHNNYAKKPGKDGEDQCAACHGNDHKGTRLSKTPVDRVFDFSGLDFAKLQAAGFKSKVVKVAAGTEIGCDTCHSIETSCIGSPAGDQCGVASMSAPFDANRDPVISSTPTQLKAVMGEAYSYAVKASDPDGDALSYTLGLKHKPIQDENGNTVSEMAIDASGVVTTTWPEALFTSYKHGPFTFPYSVNVSDGKGGYAVQNVEVTLECPQGKAWRWTGGMWDGHGACVEQGGVVITSKPAVDGVNTGSTGYSYQVVANTDPANLPITYSFTDFPGSSLYAAEGIQIDPATGLITWKNDGKGAKTVWYGQALYQVKATNSKGESDTQLVTVTVCVKYKAWSQKAGVCR